MEKITLITASIIISASFSFHVNSSELCEIIKNASIIAQDENNTYLGKISNRLSKDSIFNEFNQYGNRFNTNSIWNEFGQFGSEFSNKSAFNKFTSSPPMIIRNSKVIGYLSVNENINGSISPNLLKALCEEEI